MNPPKGRHWRSDPRVLDELDRRGLIEWSSRGVPRKIIYADEKEKVGMKLQDIIEFKDMQNPSYPTEKNLDLLKLLISISSNERSIVLDCFCGSGTTLHAAQSLGRSWIGIDQSERAIETSLSRMTPKQMTLCPESRDFEFLVQSDSRNPSLGRASVRAHDIEIDADRADLGEHSPVGQRIRDFA